jgi:hypothetical protein
VLKAIAHVVISALLAGSTTLVRAESAEQIFQFDCDVPAGRASDWSGTVPPGLSKISGRVELIEPRRNEKWLPVASVWLERGDERVGLQVHLAPSTPEVVQVSVVKPEDDGGRTLLTTAPWRAHAIAFTLTYEASGEIRLAIEGKEASLGVTDFRADKLSLGCSSGQFKFVDVAVTSDAEK